MIDIKKQVKVLKSKLHGERIQYVVVPTMNSGAVLLGITKGKRFDFAMYRDNMNFRRAK